ncbi:hypothetical protein niasHT_031767 [Heterodera trifolii]|uniref:Uncharacterized protein n=1 Tax=Heterodera trifolii TaxID=157864 RepID=A0ABD2IJB1_9BILA
MSPSADSKMTPQQQQQPNHAEGTEEEAAINIGLSTAVVEVHEQLASQMDLCNNLLGQFASLRHISSTPYAVHVPLVNSLALRRRHPNWTVRLKVRLHSSLSECVENLRQFSAHRLPTLARQFDRAQSSTKDDVSLLVADFEFSLAVDSARPVSSLVERYTFETDDRALVAAHLRRLAARLDAELDRLTNLVGFEIDDDGAAETAANRAKMRRHSFALKGSTKSSNKSAAAFAGANNRWSISLEPCLMLMNNNGNIDTAGVNIINTSGGGGAEAVSTRHRSSVNALPDWSVELALGRLSTGGGRFF